MNNATSLMDLQVGWRFTKGQNVSEIQETVSSERGRLGLCQVSFVAWECIHFSFRDVLLIPPRPAKNTFIEGAMSRLCTH